MTRLDYPEIGESLYLETLPNGLPIAIVPKPGYTRSHAFFAASYGGSDRRFSVGGELRDTPAGVAHFLEHKMFDMPGGENILAVLESNGASPNAYTSADTTAYFFESTQNFDENLRILLNYVSTPYFTPETVQKERGIIAQEIRMGEDDPDSVVFEELKKCLYARHPIRDSIAGTVESIAEITADTLYACHKAFYAPSNMCLAVAGDVDPESVVRAALDILPAEKGERPVCDYGGGETLLPVRERFTKRMEVSAPQLMIGAKADAPAGGPELLRHKLVAGLAKSCLFGRSSVFYNRMYADGLLNADFFSDAYYRSRTLTLLLGGESRDPEAVLGAVRAELERAVREGLDEALLDRLKKAAYGARIRSLSNFGGLCASLADAAFNGYNAFDSFAAAQEVSAEDVYKFISESLSGERLAMSVILPLAGGGKEKEADCL